MAPGTGVRDSAANTDHDTRCVENNMSFALYMVGLALLVGGIAWGLITAGLAAIYVGIACLIVGGIGVMMAVSRTRAKDPPA